MSLQKALEITKLPAPVFEQIFGEVVRIIEIHATNGKTYSVVIGSKNYFADLPIPEDIEEFQNNYKHAVNEIIWQFVNDYLTKIESTDNKNNIAFHSVTGLAERIKKEGN